MSSREEQINIRLSRQERRTFDKAARKKHKKLSEWFRDLAWRELERQQRLGRNGDRQSGAPA